MTHIIDCGVNPPKPQQIVTIGTVRMKPWFQQIGVPKGKRRSLKPRYDSFVVIGKFDTYAEYRTALREKIDADIYDLRTIRFHSEITVPAGQTHVSVLDMDRD